MVFVGGRVRHERGFLTLPQRKELAVRSRVWGEADTLSSQRMAADAAAHDLPSAHLSRS